MLMGQGANHTSINQQLISAFFHLRLGASMGVISNILIARCALGGGGGGGGGGNRLPCSSTIASTNCETSTGTG